MLTPTLQQAYDRQLSEFWYFNEHSKLYTRTLRLQSAEKTAKGNCHMYSYHEKH